MNQCSLDLTRKPHVEFREQVWASDYECFHLWRGSKEMPARHHLCFAPEGSLGHQIHHEPQPSVTIHRGFCSWYHHWKNSFSVGLGLGSHVSFWSTKMGANPLEPIFIAQTWSSSRRHFMDPTLWFNLVIFQYLPGWGGRWRWLKEAPESQPGGHLWQQGPGRLQSSRLPAMLAKSCHPPWLPEKRNSEVPLYKNTFWQIL